MIRGLILGLTAGILLGCSPSPGTERAARADKPWHTADGFQNLPGAINRDVPWTTYFTFSWQRFRAGGQPVPPPGHVLPEAEALAGLAEMQGADSLTWLGHAAFLLRLSGLTVLTDPFLTDLATPFSFGGPRRFAPPGITIENLPPIDVIVLSHNHYDSLDVRTLDALPNKGRIQVVAPLGLGKYFRDRGYGPVHELDWYEESQVGPLRITALPSQHWSRRGMFDQNDTLWMGAAIESPEVRVYFSGDTGYGPNFVDLGAQFGPFDLGLIGIGAYEPRAMMKATHTTPEEAISIGLEMGAETIVGMHWGAIALGTEAPFEAPDRFRAAAQAAGVPPENAWIMAIGETRPIR